MVDLNWFIIQIGLYKAKHACFNDFFFLRFLQNLQKIIQWKIIEIIFYVWTEIEYEGNKRIQTEIHAINCEINQHKLF